MGKAVCLAETGKVAEGIAMLQELINKNDPQDSLPFGRIYNALGRCYVKENKAKTRPWPSCTQTSCFTAMPMPTPSRFIT